MPHTETTLPSLTKPNAFEEAGGILQGRQPRREFELAEIQRRIAQAGLQQQAAQEHRLEQDQRLKQFGALSTIAKVINTLGVPEELKETWAKKLASEAALDKMPITDDSFFKALVNQPNELAKFMDNYRVSITQGDDPMTALTKGSQGIQDPEVQKTISETFQKLVVEGGKSQQPKLSELKAQAVQLEVSGNKEQAKILRDAIKDIEATPQGAESRIYDALVEKHTALGASSPRIAAANEFLGFVGSKAFVGAGGRARGEEQAKENFPLDLEAYKWINPETGLPAKAIQTRKEAREKGFVPVSEGALNAVSTAKAALAQIKEYRSLAPKLLVSITGDIGKDIANVQINKGKILLKAKGGDPSVKRLLGLQGGIATLARATGDTANIAVAEREMLKEFALTDEDSIQSSEAKLNQAERILKSVISAKGIPLPPGTETTIQTGKKIIIPVGVE